MDNKSRNFGNRHHITKQEALILLGAKDRCNGLCQLCGLSGKLELDHEHADGNHGLARGWVDHNCNVALATVDRNPALGSQLVLDYIAHPPLQRQGIQIYCKPRAGSKQNWIHHESTKDGIHHVTYNPNGDIIKHEFVNNFGNKTTRPIPE